MASREKKIAKALKEIESLMPALMKSEADDLFLVVPSKEESKTASDFWRDRKK